MTPQAIAKLRRSFIMVATMSFLVVIVFMGVTTAITNMVVIRNQANAMIDAIFDADGEMPTAANFASGTYNEEAMYGLRYFTVKFDRQGDVIDIDLNHVALIDADRAIELSRAASDPAVTSGITQYDTYFFKEAPTDYGSMVVFLDSSFQLENMGNVLSNTLLLSFVAFLVTLVSVFFFSKRAIAPEVARVRSQQQFMTNASHELKTPIAVIRANTELTEMISGETEWTRSTINQVDRLDELVQDLMTIVRGQEHADTDVDLTDVDVSTVVSSAVDSFKAMAQQNSLQLDTSIESGVTVRGNEASIEQLVCLLVDNAIKYCDREGSIHVRLTPAIIGRGCTLTVSNNYAAGGDVDYHRFFDRFYRADESHENQQGYGIGLSVAQSICEQYHGSIKVGWKAGMITFTCNLKDRFPGR